MRVSIFGLEHAGVVAAACLAESGHEVIAVDTNAVRVNGINDGQSPVIEAGLSELIRANVKNGRLRATTDSADAVINTEISLIYAGTPSKKDGTPMLDYIRSACCQI